MILTAIAAMGSNRVIGRDGDLPWHLPEDMRFFRQTTKGRIMIMGRKTLESFPGLLPGRFHIVVTRKPDYVPPKSIVGDSDQFLVVQSVQEALAAAEALVESEPDWGEEVFNIGGGEMYAALLPVTDKILLTEIELKAEGDAHFPRWHEGDFEERSRREGTESGTNGLPHYQFVSYERVAPKAELD